MFVASGLFSVQLKQEIIILSKEGHAGQPPNASVSWTPPPPRSKKYLVAVEPRPLPCRLAEGAVVEILDMI